jgi:hypothetical protein
LLFNINEAVQQYKMKLKYAHARQENGEEDVFHPSIGMEYLCEGHKERLDAAPGDDEKNN